MTGEKNRFKTHEKLWNIDDKSLKTPKHDTMVLWLMDEDNLNKLDFPKFPTHEEDGRLTMRWLKKYSEHIDELEKLEKWFDAYNTFDYPPLPKKIASWDNYEGEYEKAVETDKLNFIQNLSNELSKICSVKEMSGTKLWEAKANYIWDIRTEVPLNSSPTFIAGYADLIVYKQWHDDLTITFKKQMFDLEHFYDKILSKTDKMLPVRLWETSEKEMSSYVNTTKYLIEVKPYVDSFGAVMRQLNSYKKFSNAHVICLFTLDARFDKQFESQGITVLHPPEDVDMDEYAMEMGLDV